jgi:threonine/homoserine/homoserine lactone efflux protein
MNVTNPKVSLFFLAFLPQFADPSRGPVMVQLLLLGGLFIVATLTVFSAIALAAGSLGEALKRSLRIQRSLNRVSGLVFLGLALRLATAHR